MEWLLLVLIGLAAGTLGSLIGLGGGIIIVPALLALSISVSDFSSITPQIAAGTSLIITIVTAISSTITYVKHKTVDYYSGLILFIGTAPGGLLGAWVNKFLDVKDFQLYFGIFLILLSVIFFLRNRGAARKRNENPIIKRTFTTPDGQSHTFGFNPYIAVPLTFVIGFTSGLFGIGGGALLVPLMIMLYVFPPHIAVATSMFVILLTSIVGSAPHIIYGNVEWMYVLLLAPGAWIGAKLGSKINTRLKGNTVVTLLRIILLILGIKMIYDSIMG